MFTLIEIVLITGSFIVYSISQENLIPYKLENVFPSSSYPRASNSNTFPTCKTLFAVAISNFFISRILTSTDILSFVTLQKFI